MTRVFQLFFLVAFFALIFFIVTRVLGISVSVGTSPDTPEAFAETIGAPIDLIIVGPDADAAALRQLIIATDESGLINQETVPTELDDADAVVFLMNEL